MAPPQHLLDMQREGKLDPTRKSGEGFFSY